MSESNSNRSVKPPYISQNVWKPFLERMQRLNRPKELSLKTLKSYGFAQEPALQSALKFLGLIDEKANTTDKFGLIQVQGEQFQKNLTTLIKGAYQDLFNKHPIDHANYDDIVNYFVNNHSAASSKKMAKSFAVLCQLAGIESPAFSKMRALDNAERQVKAKLQQKEIPTAQTEAKAAKGKSAPPPKDAPQDEDLVREFIKTNPMPTGFQWDAESLKTYFAEYRETLKMLQGDQEKEG